MAKSFPVLLVFVALTGLLVFGPLDNKLLFYLTDAVRVLPGLEKIVTPAGQTLPGMVVRVSDGDTVTVKSYYMKKEFKCRLYGIDAPETEKPSKPGQDFGVEATAELKSLVLKQDVSVTLTGEKTYDRQVCLIHKGTQDINLEMIKRGYAWAYRQHLKLPYSRIYVNAQKEARIQRIGLWKQANPEPPWKFRKRLMHDNN